MIPGKGFQKYKSIKVWGFALLILSHCLYYPMKMKLFHFHRIFNSEECVCVWGG